MQGPQRQTNAPKALMTTAAADVTAVAGVTAATQQRCPLHALKNICRGAAGASGRAILCTFFKHEAVLPAAKRR